MKCVKQRATGNKRAPITAGAQNQPLSAPGRLGDCCREQLGHIPKSLIRAHTDTGTRSRAGMQCEEPTSGWHTNEARLHPCGRAGIAAACFEHLQLLAKPWELQGRRQPLLWQEPEPSHCPQTMKVPEPSPAPAALLMAAGTRDPSGVDVGSQRAGVCRGKYEQQQDLHPGTVPLEVRNLCLYGRFRPLS